MTHLPHGMKELRYAGLSEPGMKSCQDCERRSTISNGVGSVKCCEGIIAGAIFHNQGCSLMSCVKNNSRILYVTPGSELGFQLTEFDNPAANEEEETNSFSLSLQPGDYMETDKGYFRIITEVTNSEVHYFLIAPNTCNLGRYNETVIEFLDDMAYYGITKIDGSIFDVGFKFDLPNTINEEYTVKSNINQFNTGITFHSSARYTTTVPREEVIEGILKSFYVPQFNSKRS